MREMLKRLWNWGATNTRRAARVRRPVLSLEVLEDRACPAAIHWVNRGQASDNFTAVFAQDADLARQVVDTAIRQWAVVIGNFNRPDGSNRFDITISMNTDQNSDGGNGGPTEFDSAGKPKAGSLTIGRNGFVQRDANNNVTNREAWYLDDDLRSSGGRSGRRELPTQERPHRLAAVGGGPHHTFGHQQLAGLDPGFTDGSQHHCGGVSKRQPCEPSYSDPAFRTGQSKTEMPRSLAAERATRHGQRGEGGLEFAECARRTIVVMTRPCALVSNNNHDAS